MRIIELETPTGETLRVFSPTPNTASQIENAKAAYIRGDIEIPELGGISETR